MAIESTELKIYESTVINDTDTNGAYMSANEITSGSANNLFPNVPQDERTAGSTKYRKFFFKIADSENNTLFNSKIHMSLQTPAEDYVTFFEGTQADTQVSIGGSEDQFGCGSLNTTVSGGATSIDVFIEASGVVIFRNGEDIKIWDGTNMETRTLSGVSPSGNVITLTVPALTNGYSSTNTLVASIFEPADIECSYTGMTATSGSGTYDDTTYPIALKNIGTIQEDVTITFTSGTTFTCAGARTGAMGSGNTTSDFQPLNGDFSEYYFVLNWLGWSGTWATNDTLEFTTVPAAAPIWAKRVVPAGAVSYSGNNFKLILDGESS